MNVFSWAKLQPYEEGYNFSELDDIVEMLSKENYDIVPATSVEELQKYPEAERIDYEGRKDGICRYFHIYKRFNSDGMSENYVVERDAIREFDKETPITTNLMVT